MDSIPMYFKNTNEAQKYARQHVGDVLVRNVLGLSLLENLKILEREKKKENNLQEVLNFECKCQFLREALEIISGEAI